MQKPNLSGRVPYLGLSIQEVATLERTPGAPDRGDRGEAHGRLLSGHVCKVTCARVCTSGHARAGEGLPV